LEYKKIPISALELGSFYIGRGRNSNIGKWDGDVFLVLGEQGSPKLSDDKKSTTWTSFPTIKREPYYTDEQGCFQPFLKIDEGEMIESFGKSGWDKHYGTKLKFLVIKA